MGRAQKQTKRHYSGPESGAFWRRVNKLGGDVYLAAILLQEMEERVLSWVENAHAQGTGRLTRALTKRILYGRV
jgi:hypothetical protein